IALGAIGATALAATAAEVVVGTSVTATSAAHQVRAGQTFAISGHLFHGTSGLAGQNVSLLERSGPTQKWNKATNSPSARAVTDAKGNVSFPVPGLSHGEQSMVYPPSQTVSGKPYGASESRVITVLRATS